MKIEEAVLNLEDGLHWMEDNDVPKIFERIRFKEGLRVAISALRAQQEVEKNEPLALEELKEMEGQPVVWKCLLIPHLIKWKVLERFGEKMEFLGWTDGTHDMFHDYGCYYVCYRRPPKEAHNV